jgi:predicted DNA-binding transcriptional regulator AlpA
VDLSDRTVRGPAQEWLNLQEVADYLCVSEATVRAMLRSGDFPPPAQRGPRNHGGKRLWPWDVVRSWAVLNGYGWPARQESSARQRRKGTQEPPA